MNDFTKQVLHAAGITFENVEELNGLVIERDILLSTTKYEEIKKLIPELKTKFSSSSLTSLQQNAEQVQHWPLINIVRQLLKQFKFIMIPFRKSDGYINGVKKYKRYFRIERKNQMDSNHEPNTFSLEYTK